jgi:hypothetical protein
MALWCAPASAECLSRPVKDADGKDTSFAIQVPASEVAAYQAKGFSSVACEAVQDQLDQQGICEIADIKNSAIQARFEHVFGATAMELCRSAKLVNGAPDAAQKAPDEQSPGH